MSQPNIYIIYPLFFGFFPHEGYPRALNRLPELPSRSLLPIDFAYGSVYLSIPTSQSIRPQKIAPLVTTSLVSKIFESVSVPWTSSFAWSFIIFYTFVTSCGIFPSPSGLLHVVWQSLGPSMPSQMAPLHDLPWWSDISWNTRTTSLLSDPLSMNGTEFFNWIIAFEFWDLTWLNLEGESPRFVVLKCRKEPF